MTLLDFTLRVHYWWIDHWHLPRGRWIFRRILACISAMGFYSPQWFRLTSGAEFYVDPRDFLQREILLTGGWELAETRELLAALSPGHVMIDIGANVGYFTVIGAQAVGPTGRIIAVEPNPSAVHLLRMHLERNGLTNVLIEAVACSDYEGRSALFLSDTSNIGKCSLSPINAGAQVSQNVCCTTIDALVHKHALGRLDLVKIDAEGNEMNVLRGMCAVLARFRPTLLMELEPILLASFGTTIDDVRDFLRSFGYDRGRSICGTSNNIFKAQ